MRDRDVRMALHRRVLREHHKHPNTLVLNELGLCHGACRVDIAVVNGRLHGYEIKSDSDTLERLDHQIKNYSSVLDRAWLVVGEKHLSKAMDRLPDWWGVKSVSQGPRDGISFENYRKAADNPKQDPVAIAQLLWHVEAANILRTKGASEAELRRPRAILYGLLAEAFDLQSLRDLVRQQLKERANWRDQ
mgnify:CR=1 FL=1